MPGPIKICEGVHQVGGPSLSNPSDASVFLVDSGNSGGILIDSGAGKSFERLVSNIMTAGFECNSIKVLILTHCHIDHIGSAWEFKNNTNCRLVAHEKDLEAIEGRNPGATAADWYGIDYHPVTVDEVLRKRIEVLKFGHVEFNCLHTPGHTPGSISIYCDIGGNRILFGQDIHGPFDKSFGSNIQDWRDSMGRLLELEADILCEGHYGIYRPRSEVERYIRGYLNRY
jgi:glyoxylase-like metal-dependent hydrolase (beta-lactamase superfamily II)